MQIVGLTGSIAMGKSYAARMFARYGVPLFDSDAAVHRLFAADGPLPARIDALFPGCLQPDGAVDRQALGARVVGTPGLRQLEELVHPAVRDLQIRFLGEAARAGIGRVLLDIPLLYETGAETRMDAVIVVACSQRLQRQRALRRAAMTEQRLDAVLAKQMPTVDKVRCADFVLPSGYDRGETARRVCVILDRLDGWQQEAWPARWLYGGRSSPPGNGAVACRTRRR